MATDVSVLTLLQRVQRDYCLIRIDSCSDTASRGNGCLSSRGLLLA